ncbi:MAG: ECF transporter S component [Clostridia bacterium]|nr:ECF transporter S component [Clostridia bacterium]
MKKGRILRFTQIAILTALVVVLQLLSYVIKIGTFPLSLVLIPLVVGGALFGPRAGGFLGLVFGVVVTIGCITGFDVGGAILWNVNPFLTALVCLVKGAVAGFIGGLIATILQKKGHSFLGVLLSAIVVPLVNTGLFTAAMWFLFKETLVSWAGGQNVVYYVFFGLIGINFVIEFVINLVLAPTSERIVNVIRHTK